MSMVDIVFIFLCTVLVMLMTPGLALFYGGMVRSKNVLNTTMHSYTIMFLVSIQWIVVGYSLAFGTSIGGFIGDMSHFMLNGVGFEPHPDYLLADGAFAHTIPQNLFMMFQMMFAIITPALISGAYAERMKFGAFVVFTLLWVTLVYDPIANWVWASGGWLFKLGALDFAGGNVVHISSGVSGLVLALMLGKRKHKESAVPHQIPMVILGAGLLWFGWFGFNAGSALSMGELAMTAFITTNTAAAAAAIAWMIVEWIVNGKPTALGAASGLVAGLVSITPGAGFVSVSSALVIGFLGGIICFLSVVFLKNKLGYDDALDAFGVHGIGGTWGGLATGLFAQKAINSAGADGLFYGGDLLWKQAVAIGATYVYAAAVTFIIIVVIKMFMKIRAAEDEEEMGMDISSHGESAYKGITM